MGNKNNPINLSQKARRNLYLSNRDQIERDRPELLPDFDRLHLLKHQEFPRLHEFRMGWICAREYERENALLSEYALDHDNSIVMSKDVYSAWVDSVLQASATISRLEDLVKSLSLSLPETLDQEIERLR